MGKIFVASILMTIVLTQTLIIPPLTLAIESEAPSPFTEIDELVPAGALTIDPDFIEFMKGCAEKIDRKCGEQMFKHLIDDKHVSRSCCKEILAMGMDCHIALVRVLFDSDTLKKYAADGISKSEKIWNTCVADVGAEMGVPVPLEFGAPPS